PFRFSDLRSFSFDRIDRCPAGMVLIPAGTFTVPAVGRAKKVKTVSEFCLDVDEVTVGEYAKCVNDSGACSEPDEHLLSKSDRQFCNWNHPYWRNPHPINCVDWYQAVQFCAWSGKRRLPTDEEWEWAARGGDKGWDYPWGTESPSTHFNLKPPHGF